MPADRKTRKQLNIGLSPDQFELVKTAADREELTITAFCRDAILDAAQPDPELDEMGHGLPAWLAAVLIFLSRPGREQRKETA